MKTYYIETLGCPKNFNDSEYATGVLEQAGYHPVSSPGDADFVIVNTCGFIEDAKRESIDKIFEMAREKSTDAKLVVTGCLAQRYAEELFQEMPEVDCFMGVNQYDQIGAILDNLKDRGLYTNPCNTDYLEKAVRKYEAVPYSATIKIAEGCDNNCAYCIIPAIRGKYRSKRIEDILAEARELAEAGCKELILIAQDVTYYGHDLYGRYALPELLDNLNAIEGIQWIRLMYCYDNRITDELIDSIIRNEKVCHYIDLPLQHSSDKVLKEMNRGSTRSSIEGVIKKLRTMIPDIAIRTSLIVGFPGEGEEDFEDLLDFVEKARLDRVGVFKYSQEEGTPAGIRKDQVDDETKEMRYDAVMRRQLEISLEHNQRFIDTVQDVIVDYFEDGNYVGRTQYDAPEIDDSVIFTSARELEPGDIVKVRITDAFDYDLVGAVEE